MSPLAMICVFLLLAAWIAFAVLCRFMVGTFAGEVARDLAWVAAGVYARVVHRVRYEGVENLPRWRVGDAPIGPLVVVSNHTAGVDPLLIQSACRFEIRWMMMRDMMPARFAELWSWIGVIPVDKGGRETMSLRTAVRHLAESGVLGIFAEGGIERPPGVIMTYQPGVGLLVSRANASVLPVVVSGTPRTRTAYASLLLPSRASVKFLPIRRYDTSRKPGEIAEELEALAARELGWPRTGGRT